jgi:hypothetical protein
MGWIVSKKPSSDESDRVRLHRVVLDDLRRGDLRRTFHRDLRDIYSFFLDEESRTRLASMGRLKRWLFLVGWLAKSLFLNLSPVRRILLLVSVLFFFQAGVVFRSGNQEWTLRLAPLAFLILLFILMLELKDKLLAREEFAIGRAVQMALLPVDCPQLAGWDLWLYTRPANDVGGDLVDYLRLEHGRLGLALGDVAGKGLGAALLMSKLQATIRAIATETASLADLGAKLNVIFCRDQVPGRYATLVYLEIGPDSGAVRVLNAGHLPPVVVGRLGSTPMEPASPPIGLLPGTTYVHQQVELEPLDSLLVYSDGITEARNAQGEFFGEERLMQLLPLLRDRSARDSAAVILSEVERFVGEERYADDLSVIVLKRV